MVIKPSDVIALVSAAIAALALMLSLYATYVTQRVATSGFQSAERVKLDTAQLLSALRGVMIKSALYSQQDPRTRHDPQSPDYIDIRPEKAAIQSFLDSSTAIAYYDFVAGRSRKATDAGKAGEEWRLFFLNIAQLLHTGNTYNAGLLAGRIEKMFDTVSDDDLEQMSSGLEDLSAAVKRILQDRPHDPLLSVLVDAKSQERDSQDFEGFVRYLRKQGVQDPDVDLFWSAMHGDPSLAEDALKRGAKVHTTDQELIARHKALWDAFQAAEAKKKKS
jgi:hypothetical protein